MQDLVMTTLSREDFKEIIKECFKDEIDKLKLSLEPKATTPPYLTVKQLTKLFGVSKVTVRNWTNQGHLTAFKAGNRRVFYKKEEIESFLTEIKMSIGERRKLQEERENNIFLRIKELEQKNGIPLERDLSPAAELLKRAIEREKRMKAIHKPENHD